MNPLSQFSVMSQKIGSQAGNSPVGELNISNSRFDVNN